MIYWLTTMEFSLGFYSSLRKARDAANRFCQDMQDADPEPIKWVQHGKSWRGDDHYMIHIIDADQIDIDQW